MSGETADCLVIRWADCPAPGNCAGPASAPSSPGAVVPEATSWAGSGTLSPLYPRRYYCGRVDDAGLLGPVDLPELAREVAAHGGITPEGTPGGWLILDTNEARHVLHAFAGRANPELSRCAHGTPPGRAAAGFAGGCPIPRGTPGNQRPGRQLWGLPQR